MQEEKRMMYRRPFQNVLARVVSDLCLPSVLVVDIMTTFTPLQLFTIGIDIPDYTPAIRSWRTDGRFPSVFQRVLALIMIALKFHFGLDDQYEVFFSHNLKIIQDRGHKQVNNDFDFMQWLNLSKLR